MRQENCLDIQTKRASILRSYRYYQEVVFTCKTALDIETNSRYKVLLNGAAS